MADTDVHPYRRGNPDVLVVLAGVRLGDLAPARSVEQDDDGLYACFGWRIGRNESPHEFPRSQGWGQAFRSVIVQPPPSSHALSCSLSATDESKYRSHPRLSALWNECLTTLSHTVEKSFFFARRVTLGSSIIRFIVIIVRCGPVVDRRPRWRVGKTRSGV